MNGGKPTIEEFAVVCANIMDKELAKYGEYFQACLHRPKSRQKYPQPQHQHRWLLRKLLREGRGCSRNHLALQNQCSQGGCNKTTVRLLYKRK